MKKKEWKFFFKPENIPYGITILAAIGVAILGLIGKVGSSIINTTILFVLTSITSLLLVSHIVITRLNDQLKDPPIVKILKPYNEIEHELKNRLNSAEEVWLLSRTGRGFLERNFKNEFDNIINKGKARFLFINPKNGALKMLENTVDVPHIKEELRFSHQKGYIGFLNLLSPKCGNGNKLKVIDHLPAWTLIIFNPSKRNEQSVIFVELGKYRSEYKYRPAFKITLHDGEYFDRFLSEFNEMWKDAKDWQPEDEASGENV